MEFTLTSPSVNCVKQSSCLNDQGGINADKKGWRDFSPSAPYSSIRFGIAFKQKVLSIIPIYRLKEKRNESPVIANTIHSTITNTGFEYIANEVGGGEQSCSIEFVAIGY